MPPGRETAAAELARLAEEALGCARCGGLGFESSPMGGYWKFPPVVGKQGHVPLLFVGLNPRRDVGNQHLYEMIMRSRESFLAFASNRVGGRGYISARGDTGDDHYATHVDVTRKVFPLRQFEDVAAVAEYYLCGGDRSVTRGLPRPSRCAPHFLDHVVRLVRPTVILPLGEVVMDYFRAKARASKTEFTFPLVHAAGTSHVVALPHPGARARSEQRRLHTALLDWAPRAARAVLDGAPVPSAPSRP